MWAVLLVAAPVSLSAVERAPVAVLVSTPRGHSTLTARSELLRGIAERFDRHTDLAAEVLDDAALAACEGRLACVLRRASPRAQLLLEVVIAEGSGADSLTVSLYDVGRASPFLDRDPLEAEGLIAERAVVGGPVRARVAGLDRFLDDLFRDTLAPPLRRYRHWRRYGTIRLTAPANLTIRIGDRIVGAPAGGAVELRHVETGTRTLSLMEGPELRWSSSVYVKGAVDIEAHVAEPPDPTIPIVRASLLWSGAALAVVGVALTVVAAARHDGNVRSGCFAGEADTCEDGRSFDRFGYDPSAAGALAFEVNPSGVAVVPLGVALTLGGAGWSAAVLTIGEEDDLPWLPAVIGVVLGAAAYGVAVAAGG